MYIICICLIFNSCGQRESKTENVNTEQTNTWGYNVNELSTEIESEIYDTDSGQFDLEWGGTIVENSEYIFYTSATALIQIKKDTMEKSVIQQWEKVSSISLYCTESEL